MQCRPRYTHAPMIFYATALLLCSTLHAGMFVKDSKKKKKVTELPGWNEPVAIAKGEQFAACTGPDGKIHVICKEYIRIAADGTVELREPVADEGQSSLGFWPAIAVGKDNSVHVVTRHGGDWSTGHEIRYRRRNAEGAWDLDLKVSDPVARNYVVAVGISEDNKVYIAHSYQIPDANMVTHIKLYTVKGDRIEFIGEIDGKYNRSDDYFKMLVVGKKIHILAGNPWPNGTVNYLTNKKPGELPKPVRKFQSGEKRKGCPWMYADKKGNIHLTYGSQHSVWYNGFDKRGKPLQKKDAMIADKLGDWHLKIGMSSIATSDDGKIIVIAVIETDGVKEAKDCKIKWRYSVDAGKKWKDLQTTEFMTDSGEGRRRPVLLYGNDKFYMLYYHGKSVKMTMMEATGD